MLKSSDSLILYLARKSIDQFKLLFPDEEPFIKIICLRDKRLQAEYKSGRRSWRKIDIIGTSGKEEIELVGTPRINTQLINTEKKVFHRDGENVTSQINRKKGKSIHAINESTGKKERVYKELTYTTKSTMKEIPTEELNVMVQSEIHTDDLDSRYDFIQVGHQEMYKTDTIDAHFKTKGLIIPHCEHIVEMVSSISEVLPRIEADSRDTELLINKMRELKKTLREHQQRIQEIEIKPNSNPKVFQTDVGVEEMSAKYILLQEKLKKVKDSIKKYTEPEELHWDDLVKKQGFVLSLIDLVKFWHTESDMYNDEYDDEDDD
jgi:hypothetical protein